MRKKILQVQKPIVDEGFRLADIADFEVSSEAGAFPLENILSGDDSKWMAAGEGEQTIRLNFDAFQTVRRIVLLFEESQISRTQEFVLLVRTEEANSWREIRRQQFNFSPPHTTVEREEFEVLFEKVMGIELRIQPGRGVASLTRLLVE